MRRIFFLLAALLLLSGTVRAQWVTFDPTNLAQSIANSASEVVETSTTAENMIKTFDKTVEIYEQGRKYYDALRKVNNVLRDARRVQQSVLMLGEMTDIYVNGYKGMVRDRNFTVDELCAIASAYNRMLMEASYMLLDLKEIITPQVFTMNDKERMDAIDKIYLSIQKQRNLIAYFTRQTIAISYIRSKGKRDAQRLLGLYGSQKERYW